ncbi:hypothetical protein KCU78_g3327, partial [Aureobasidium melanogenum]
MSTRNRTPPLLEPYLRLPSEGSQLLLTGVLDSSPQWLVTRLLRSAFTPSEETQSSEEQDVTVILVSWLRDYEFWRSEARRGAIRFCGWIDAFVSRRDFEYRNCNIDDNSTNSTEVATCEKHTCIAVTQSGRPTTISRPHTLSWPSSSHSIATTTSSTTTTTTTDPLKPTLKNNIPQRLLDPFNPHLPTLNPLLARLYASHPEIPPDPRRTNPPPRNNLHTLRLRPLFSAFVPPFLGVNNNVGS